MIEVLRTRREINARTETDPEIAAEMEAHFEALAELLERMGHRPFGRLELRIPGLAYDCQVSFFWEKLRQRS